MQVKLPQLPYSYQALEPIISCATVEIHHGKHHKAYVEKTKALAKGVRLADQPLETIIQLTAGREGSMALFNNAVQAWNHAFYWRSMRPSGGGQPDGEIAERIRSSFGDYDTFAEQFAAAAAGQFGSGWAWLVLEAGKIKITTTSNADTPLIHGQTPLLTIDMWEHAYYLDHRNRRQNYAAEIVEHLINWEFAWRNLARAHGAITVTRSPREHARPQPPAGL